MENVTIIKDSQGKEYKVYMEMAFHTDTPEKLCGTLEAWSMHPRRRVRVWLGDKDTGEAWAEEDDVTGYIRRSTGTIKIPLLVNNTRSMGGPALFDDCIVRIDDIKTHVTLWQHPTYTNPFDQAVINHNPERYPAYAYEVLINGKEQAAFSSGLKAMKYIEFMQGKRYSK